MIFWRARDVYRLKRFLVGLLLLFVAFEGSLFLHTGRWFQGLVILAVQLGTLWLLLWVLRQACRVLWWAVEAMALAIQAWWRQTVAAWRAKGETR